MTVDELRQAEAIVNDIIDGLIDPDAGDQERQQMRKLLTPAVSAGYAAGQASRAPITDRLELLAGALRATHLREMFGDCTEDGDHYPCRTIRALNITVGAPDEPVVTADDIIGG
ncbi:MAG: hypothetical protein J0J04_04995 [Microbacterium sp.]|uniref:hypothetical protein n=1 Tax=Microbacterium sp. TaxID=51671 RepID=UPI001ACAAF1E|nr:hypothetical protein [Microbacterium sp.]MBN9214165.1 hypothetical protein [Microbacterium sp.]